MPVPQKLGKIHFTSLQPDENIFLSQMIDAVNTLGGHSGEVTLSNHLNLNGNKITNVGPAETATDVLTSGQAETKYSAAALKPQLQAGGKSSLNTYRMLNASTQREQQSSWLNDLMSTPPSASTVFPTISNSGGGVSVSIPASVFTYADGSTVNIQGRVDLLSLPAQYAISSLTVSGGIVTCNCAASGLIAGEVAIIVPGTNATFAGTFQLTSSTGGGSVLQMQNPAASGTDTSGFVQIGNVYYYSIRKKANSLTLNGPYSADTAQNRLQVNYDGAAIVAVVVVTNSGAQISNSGGGGSPITGSPSAGSFFAPVFDFPIL